MIKKLRGKSAIVLIFIIITAGFAVTIYSLYDKIADSAKKDNINIYSHAMNVSYGLINDDLFSFEGILRQISTREDFSQLCAYSGESEGALDSAWQLFSFFSGEVLSNKNITDTYIIFKNNNIEISNKKILTENDPSQLLGMEGYRGNQLKKKLFSSFHSSGLLYSDRVFYNGKTGSALIYYTAVDSATLSGAEAVGAAVIPISKINELLRINSIFKNKAVLSVYSTNGYVYTSEKLKDISKYAVIDCDDNDNFSMSVYIKNSFFSDTGVYYRKMTSVLFVYAVLIIVFVALMLSEDYVERKRRQERSRAGAQRRMEINRHIAALFTSQADAEEIQWFRENLPDFPRPCIVALFKGTGIDAGLIFKAFENSSVKPAYVYPYPSGHFAAFFEYKPDGVCMDKIKSVLMDFINRFGMGDSGSVISLSSPCMDIDEIYDACRTADMMFKYNEYDSLILAGEIPAGEAFSAAESDNDKILRFLLEGNSFEANKIIYSQWYELSQHPSFGDEIKRLFTSQTNVLASAAARVEYENELPRFNPSLSVTENAFVVTGAADDIAAYVIRVQNSSTLYSDVISYIDDNFTDPGFSQTDVKEKFDISSKLISKILKQKKNMLFSEYLESLRIGKARYILAHSDIKIYDISKMCGYGTNDAFYKAFNKKEGMTPGAFRRANASAEGKKKKKDSSHKDEPDKDN